MMKFNQTLVHSKKAKAKAGGPLVDTETIKDFDTETLQKLHDYHAKLTTEIQLEIGRKKDQYRRSKAIEKDAQAARKSVKRAIALIDAGETYDSAVNTAVETSGIDGDRLKQLLKIQLKENSRWGIAARKAVIIRLAYAGLRNYEIAEQLGLHRNTVSTVIRRSLAGR